MCNARETMTRLDAYKESLRNRKSILLSKRKEIIDSLDRNENDIKELDTKLNSFSADDIVYGMFSWQELIESQFRIKAIKKYREIYGTSLKESIKAVDDYVSSL